MILGATPPNPCGLDVSIHYLKRQVNSNSSKKFWNKQLKMKSTALAMHYSKIYFVFGKGLF